jgi:hypothetical protein
MDDIARLLVSPWTLFLVKAWLLLPTPLSALAATIGAGWSAAAINIRLSAVIAGLIVGGFFVEWGILDLTERFADNPNTIYASLLLAPLAGGATAYPVSRFVTATLAGRYCPRGATQPND